MEWRRAWYEGSLLPEGWIDVDEAIAAIENISTVKTESTDNRLI